VKVTHWELFWKGEGTDPRVLMIWLVIVTCALIQMSSHPDQTSEANV